MLLFVALLFEKFYNFYLFPGIFPSDTAKEERQRIDKEPKPHKRSRNEDRAR